MTRPTLSPAPFAIPPAPVARSRAARVAQYGPLAKRIAA